eukprot:TRINITY_DN10137_c0_g1_i1.p1 TRINITY_DN10137_c0_g1~~TRINITY_DN10137_c0_g1_i1.p1  ORF type:complete len:287 (+),score=78.09 TRINITY_DN10137_c0_g1_i1:182-1042(+)
MNSIKSKFSALRSDHLQDYRVSASPFKLLESSELKPMPSPSCGDKSNGRFSQIFHDPNYSSFVLASHENRGSSDVKRELTSKARSITPFLNLITKKPEDEIVEYEFATKDTTKMFTPFDTVIQERLHKPNLRNCTYLTTSNPLAQSQESTSPLPKSKRKKRRSKEERGTEGNFACKHCSYKFTTSQGLGGHMSRKHPGKSEVYKKKKGIRKIREPERHKLQLAKKKYFKKLKYNFEELRKTSEGKRKIRELMDRKELKKIKRGLTKKELDDYIEDEVIHSDGFDGK